MTTHTGLDVGALTDAQLHRLLMALGGLLGGRQDRAVAQREIDTLAAEQVAVTAPRVRCPQCGAPATRLEGHPGDTHWYYRYAPVAALE